MDVVNINRWGDFYCEDSKGDELKGFERKKGEWREEQKGNEMK